MEILLLIVLLVLVITLLNSVRSQGGQLERISQRTQFLLEEIARLRAQRPPEGPTTAAPPKPEPPKAETPVPLPRPAPRPAPQPAP
ncbi:MAG: hypothetical protein EOO11_23205, partial [Chitinophagaceae bacterium]